MSAKQSPPNAIGLARSCSTLPGSCTAPIARHRPRRCDNRRFSPLSPAVSVSKIPPTDDSTDPPPTFTAHAPTALYSSPTECLPRWWISWTVDKSSFHYEAGTSVHPSGVPIPRSATRMKARG